MGAAEAERMALRGLPVIYDFHAVAAPFHSQAKAMCGVKTYSLCMDDSLATDALPDCPRCLEKIKNMERIAFLEAKRNHPDTYTGAA